MYKVYTQKNGEEFKFLGSATNREGVRIKIQADLNRQNHRGLREWDVAKIVYTKGNRETVEMMHRA